LLLCPVPWDTPLSSLGDITQRSTLMDTSTLCVGADVHLQEIVLRAVDKLTSDEVIAPFRVTNNLPGAQAAATELVEVATRLNYNCIQIGYEATGMLWIPFHRFLQTSQLLEPFELQQVCFNPKLVADFKHDRNTRSHVWFRWFNEFPVLILVGAVILVVVKPF